MSIIPFWETLFNIVLWKIWCTERVFTSTIKNDTEEHRDGFFPALIDTASAALLANIYSVISVKLTGQGIIRLHDGATKGGQCF